MTAAKQAVRNTQRTMLFETAKALFIKRTLGTRIAAGYLRNRGYSPLKTVDILAKGH